MSLQLFTIIGGHELVGKVIAEGDNQTHIEHPLVVRPIQKGPNQLALELFPHSLAHPEGVHVFYDSAIVSRAVEVPEELEKAYLERTTSIILSSALRDMEARG